MLLDRFKETGNGVFKYYISALEWDGGMTENADAADVLRGVWSQVKIDDLILENICKNIPSNILFYF